LGSVFYACRQFFEKCPFKEKGRFSELFCLIPRGLNKQEGFDTPLNKILRGIRPPQNKILGGIRPRGTKSCRVSDPAEQWESCVHFIADACSAVSDTLQKNFLRGLVPRLSKSSRILNPREQLLNMNISANSK
jgi:hypothetical protein